MLEKCPSCGTPKPQNFLFDRPWITGSCNCGEQLFRYEKYVSAGIPETYWYKNLEDYTGDKTTPQFQFVNKYIDKAKEMVIGGLGLYIQSDTDPEGKSYLAALILKEFIKKGFKGYFISFSDLLDNKIKSKLDADILVFDNIDLLDKTFMNAEQFSTLFKTINKRNPTIFTSGSLYHRTISEDWTKLFGQKINSTRTKMLIIDNFSLGMSIDSNNLDMVFFETSSSKKIIK